ncbi:hypothetical protein LTR85_011622 [Meristemomyces frigidus]|nr:hypothetical protein LTR85_011622 [Meristemomyces frigidus]
MAATKSRSSNTQYDNFAATYSNITDLPGEVITENLLRRGLGNIEHLDILDLACGTGLHSRLAVNLGAKIVVGVDISREMLRIGQAAEEEASSPPGTSGSCIAYHQADCSEPLDHIGLQAESFDLVMANWLFNYSSTRTELENMWRNVSRYLKPGGRFVGVGEVHEVSLAVTRSEWAGIRGSVAGETEHATKVHIELLAEPVVAFDEYILKRGDWYRDVPVEVGMTDVTFTPPSIEEVPEHCRQIQEWEDALAVPYCLLHTAIKALR